MMNKESIDKRLTKKRLRRKYLEIKFYENIQKEHHDSVFVLAPLADAYTRKGFYKEGLDVDRKLARLKPDDPIVYYNLACSLSLLGKEKEALQVLKKAVLFGYDDFSYIKKDADLERMRNLPEYEKFSSKLKRLQG